MLKFGLRFFRPNFFLSRKFFLFDLLAFLFHHVSINMSATTAEPVAETALLTQSPAGRTERQSALLISGGGDSVHDGDAADVGGGEDSNVPAPTPAQPSSSSSASDTTSTATTAVASTTELASASRLTSATIEDVSSVLMDASEKVGEEEKSVVFV